jgi:hypothetical protein
MEPVLNCQLFAVVLIHGNDFAGEFAGEQSPPSVPSVPAETAKSRKGIFHAVLPVSDSWQRDSR